MVATASSVRVRSPRARDLGSLLAGPGVTVAQQGDALSVIGRSPEWIAETAFAHGLLVHELSPVHPSLEDAYLSLTQDDVEYRAATTETTARRAAA
jgi:ABC-2 type transport system ATP-binding protein